MAIGGKRSLFSGSLWLWSAARIFLLFGISNHIASAAFVDAFAPSNWTLTNTNADGSATFGGGGATLSVVGGNNGSGIPGTTDFFLFAPVAGAVQFQYSYSSLDTPMQDFAGYLLGNSFVQIADTDGEHGTVSFTVNAGERLGFRVGTADNTGEPGILTISDFNAPVAVPEPRSALLVLLTLVLIAAARFRTGHHARVRNRLRAPHGPAPSDLNWQGAPDEQPAHQKTAPCLYHTNTLCSH